MLVYVIAGLGALGLFRGLGRLFARHRLAAAVHRLEVPFSAGLGGYEEASGCILGRPFLRPQAMQVTAPRDDGPECSVVMWFQCGRVWWWSQHHDAIAFMEALPKRDLLGRRLRFRRCRRPYSPGFIPDPDPTLKAS